MKISTKKVSSCWFDFDDSTSFSVRPYPYSNIKLGANDMMEVMFDQFCYCIVDWKGLEDDGKPFDCTEDNKKFLFDYVPEVREFIIGKAQELTVEINKELKN